MKNSEHWPLAFESGDWEGRLGGASGPAVIRGLNAAQLVKRDGHWLIRSELFVPMHRAGGVGCDWKSLPR